MTSVIVIEDDSVFRNSVIEMLQQRDETIVLNSFQSINDFTRNAATAIADLYWIDINLPDGTGIDLIQKIRQYQPNALCLICSFHADDEYIFEALKMGANGYILKNASVKKMLESIDEIIDGGSPMSPYIASRVIASFRNENANDLQDLSIREKEILEALSKGLLYKEIADKYGISKETVKKHISNIYKKLHVQNRTEAVLKYFGK